MDVLGRHILIDYYDASLDVLDDVEATRTALTDAAEAMGANIEVVEFHRFDPHGVSGTVVISESHITIHTWPEYQFAAVDVFACSDNLDLEAAREIVEGRLQPGEIESRQLGRGRPPMGERRTPTARDRRPSSDPNDTSESHE